MPRQLIFPPFNSSSHQYHISVSASTSFILVNNEPISQLPDQVKLNLEVQLSYESPKLKNESVDGYITDTVFSVASTELFFPERCRGVVNKKIDIVEIPFPLEGNMEWVSGLNRRPLENRDDMVAEIAKYAHTHLSQSNLEVLTINLSIKKTVMVPHGEFAAMVLAVKELSATNAHFYKDYFESIHVRPMRQIQRRISVIQSLKEECFQGVSHHSSNSSMEICPVCMEEFVVGSKVLKTPCSHVYHEDCLLTWVKLNSSCPYCRSDMCCSSSSNISF